MILIPQEFLKQLSNGKKQFRGVEVDRAVLRKLDFAKS